MTDPNFEAMRRAMVVSQLRPSAVSDPAIVEAMGALPREAFVPPSTVALAYVDTPLPLGGGRSLNPPLVTARLVDALGIREGDKVLVVGAATGYSAALLGALGAAVIALEEDDALAAMAAKALSGHAHVAPVKGPLAEGWAKGAPYDAILVDGAIEQVPDAFRAQLKEGGRIASAIVERGVTRLASGTRAGEVLALADFADAEAVVLPGFGRPRGFVF